MTDKIGGLIERLRVQGVWSTGLPPYMAIEAAEALAALRTQRKEVEAIANRLEDQRDEPFPGSGSERLHYWRDKAINAARHLRNLKSQEEPPCSATGPTA